MSNQPSPLAPDQSRLARVLEPEAMDTAAEALDYDQMDHSEVNRRFASDFLAAFTAAGCAENATVLDLGTGTAQIPIELCRQNPRIRVVAVDLSIEMLKLAATNITRADVRHRIQLELVDAKRLPFADGTFAAVTSNSIVHHIPRPLDTLLEAVRVVRPGGLLFFRDLARPRDDSVVAHLVKQYAGVCNEQQRKLFDDSLRAALSVDEMRDHAASLGFALETVSATSDRHWTWTAIK